MTFHITRDRLVTERFRVTADTQDAAIALLNDCRGVIVPADVEQVEESTLYSNITIEKEEAQ